MATLPFKTCFLDFNREGELVTPTQLEDLNQLAATPITDLMVISHGWNNDIGEADELYSKLQTSMQQLLSGTTHSLPGRTLGVLGVHWPSKRFADEDLIPGGAASVGDADEALAGQLDNLVKLFDGTDGLGSPNDQDTVSVLKRAKELLPGMERSVPQQDEFGRLIRSLMPPSSNEEEEVLDDVFFELDGIELLERLSRPMLDPELVGGPAMGGAAVMGGGVITPAAGGGVGLGNLFAGIKNGAQNLLNLFTYYEMKNRAGVVGLSLQRELAKFQREHPALRLHLVGHSFGGRLVSAALAGTMDGGIKANSITLLQAAFSHWGFAQAFDGQKDSFFRSALTSGRLLGPMLVTHSKKDRAVGIAYPIASRLRRQVASGLGDENDPYGGIGRNGALKTPEARDNAGELLDVPNAYPAFVAGRVYNLNGDQRISGHSDVASVWIAHAILSAMR